MNSFTRYLLIFVLFALVSCDEDEKLNRAISFDGTDDLVDLTNVYDDAELPITISSWIKVAAGKDSQTPIFVSQDEDGLYKGFWLVINPTILFAGYGDGLGGNNPAFRSDKSAVHSHTFGTWIHVSAVIRGASNMDIYLNGENIGGEYSGLSNNPMGSNFPNAIANMGRWKSNSNTYRYKGLMDEIKIWNRALSESEIKADMKKRLKGNETGLIGYWDFEEKDGITALDKSENEFKGELKGNPERVVSDIPGLQ